ncbi:aromatic ring-hydroxylating oxygenase subunit alpha [Rhodococcus baikonurensis]|uniref:Rieske 2Fe-2S domain-containing protein n=1 Tax=Rhodococcus baikonurensis TaxID=172041 RepID=A0ABV5XFN8_9NOCA
MFTRTWQIACRVEELRDVGCFVEYEIGKFSILLVRESKTQIRAYHNACRHRGTRLARGRGRVGSLICPFHGWRWNLDGSIRLVLDREEFVPRSDDDLGLVRVHAEQWGGFVFINLDPDPMPLLEYLDPVARIFAPFQLENFRYRWGKGVIAPCNWKTAMDAFLEAYHVAGTHPQLFRLDKSDEKLLHEGTRQPVVGSDNRLRAACALLGSGAQIIHLQDRRQGPVEEDRRRQIRRAPEHRGLDPVPPRGHARSRERTQLARRGSTQNSRTARRHDRGQVLPPALPRAVDRRRLRLAGHHPRSVV